jgi:hypothetical protein
MSTIWGTHDQAQAWVMWRDEESVTRVGPGGDIDFRALSRIREFYEPRVSRPLRVSQRPPGKPPGNGWPKIARTTTRAPTNEAVVTVTPEGDARITTPTPRLGSPADLYEACARGKVIVWGRFKGRELKLIPAREWCWGRPPDGWACLTFDMTELRQEFPAKGRAELRGPDCCGPEPDQPRAGAEPIPNRPGGGGGKAGQRGPVPTADKIRDAARPLIANSCIPAKTISWDQFHIKVCSILDVKPTDRGYGLDTIQRAVRPLLPGAEKTKNTAS